jgi:hypothetical protein
VSETTRDERKGNHENIKIELGNSSSRAYDYSIRLYPFDGRVLKLFPVESFEVVGQSE